MSEEQHTFTFTCTFCHQENKVAEEVEVDQEPFCKHPTDDGFCTRQVDSWDNYCWQHQSADK